MKVTHVQPLTWLNANVKFTNFQYFIDLPRFSKGHGAESEKSQIHLRENILKARGQNWG